MTLPRYGQERSGGVYYRPINLISSITPLFDDIKANQGHARLLSNPNITIPSSSDQFIAIAIAMTNFDIKIMIMIMITMHGHDHRTKTIRLFSVS
jgi:hypothetical protein